MAHLITYIAHTGHPSGLPRLLILPTLSSCLPRNSKSPNLSAMGEGVGGSKKRINLITNHLATIRLSGWREAASGLELSSSLAGKEGQVQSPHTAPVHGSNRLGEGRDSEISTLWGVPRSGLGDPPRPLHS